MEQTIISNSVEETKELATKIIAKLHVGDVVLLSGDLGAGKTTFVSGILNCLGYDGHVISPTFNILKCYFEVTPHIYHIDAYRLEDQNIDIGLEEYIEGDGIAFVEWPQFIEPILPKNRLEIKITTISEFERCFKISSSSNKYDELIKSLEK